MARIQTRKQSSEVLTSGGVLTQINRDIDRNAFIQEIDLDVKVQVDTGASSLTNLRRLWSNMAVTWNGQNSYFSLSSLQCFHINKRDYGTEAVNDTFAASTANQIVRSAWRLDTRPNPNLMNDFSAVIPAMLANQLKLQCTPIADVTIFGSSPTIDFSNLDVHLVELIPESKEETDLVLKNLWAIHEFSKQDEFAAVTSNFGNRSVVPTGYLIKDMFIFFRSAAGEANVNDTLLNTSGTAQDQDFRIVLNKPEQKTLYQSSGFHAVNKDKSELALETRDAGITKLDFWNNMGGLALERFDEGSIVTEFNNTVNTGGVDIVYRRYNRNLRG